MSAEAFEQEIEKNEPILKQYAGDSDWHWLRFPFLSRGDTLEKRRAVRAWLAAHDYADRRGQHEASATISGIPSTLAASRNTTSPPSNWLCVLLPRRRRRRDCSYAGALSKEVYGRDIPYVLLMHIGAFDARMLRELIALYRSRGFSFVSLPEAEKDPAYSDDADTSTEPGGTGARSARHQAQATHPASAQLLQTAREYLSVGCRRKQRGRSNERPLLTSTLS